MAVSTRHEVRLGYSFITRFQLLTIKNKKKGLVTTDLLGIRSFFFYNNGDFFWFLFPVAKKRGEAGRFVPSARDDTIVIQKPLISKNLNFHNRSGLGTGFGESEL